MPKAELLDPQGKAVAGALARTGRGEFGVRVGKRFEITTDGPADAETPAGIEEIARDILSNSVIEDVVGIRVVEEAATGAHRAEVSA
jgi:phosphoribosylformylglycinamidine synthase